MTTKEALLEIGLTDKEAVLYLTSIQIGPATVLKLSKVAKIHRTIVYQLLDNLVQKGIFRITVDGKRKLYVASEPKHLLGYLKLKESMFKEFLPELNALSNLDWYKPKILYFEGREELRELFKTGLQAESKEMYSFFPSKYMAELFGKRGMEQIISARVQRKIKVKTLRSSLSEEAFEGSKETTKALREVRYIPHDKELGMGLVIFDDKVNIFSPLKENFGIQIQSKSYAEFMRYFFEVLWEISKE